MSNEAGSTLNITEHAYSLARETGSWLSGNIVGLLVAIAAGIVLALVLFALRSLGCRLIDRGPGELHWRVIFARVVARTRPFFIVIVSIRLVCALADMPPRAASFVHLLFVIATAFQAAIWGRELILGYVEHRAGADQQHSNLASALSIIRVLSSIALFAIALVVTLDNIGVNVTGLIAGLGIGGIAIGLAAKGIFDDLFSALSIVFDKPFRRGDAVKWDDTAGTVETIGLKTTRIRATSGEEVVISNTNLLNKELHNLARLDRRRISQSFGIVYQATPEICARIPAVVEEVVASIDKCLFLRCGMTGLGASSLDFLFEFDVQTDQWQEVFEARHQVLVGLLERFHRDGIEFAYPTTTNFTAAPDGRLVMPYAEPDPS